MKARVCFIFMRGYSSIHEVGEMNEKIAASLEITRLNTAKPAKILLPVNSPGKIFLIWAKG